MPGIPCINLMEIHLNVVNSGRIEPDIQAWVKGAELEDTTQQVRGS